jgi:hypothetical protein
MRLFLASILLMNTMAEGEYHETCTSFSIVHTISKLRVCAWRATRYLEIRQTHQHVEVN